MSICSLYRHAGCVDASSVSRLRGGCKKDGYRLRLKGLEPPPTVDGVEKAGADLE
jgi:hypothetical protein